MAAGNIETTSVATMAVGTTAQFPTTLQEGSEYVVTSTVAAWAIVAATATVHGANTFYIPPNFPIVFKAPAPGAGGKLAIVADSTAGFGTLALCCA